MQIVGGFLHFGVWSIEILAPQTSRDVQSSIQRLQLMQIGSIHQTVSDKKSSISSLLQADAAGANIAWVQPFDDCAHLRSTNLVALDQLPNVTSACQT